MKYLHITALLITLIFCNNASAESNAQTEAEKLLDAMQLQKTLDAAIPIMLDTMLKHKPKIVPYKGVMLDFLSKYMSYAALKPAYIEIYANEFTAEELTEMTAFYSTQTGKKLIEKTPSIMTRTSHLGEKSFQDHMPEFEKMLGEEMTRIQLE